LVLGLLARLVHVFQRLEGQHGGADAGALAVPHQLNLALILEQQEAVFLRQGLAGLDQLDQVALLGVGQFVVVPGIAGHAQASWYSVKPATSAANEVGRWFSKPRWSTYTKRYVGPPSAWLASVASPHH